MLERDLFDLLDHTADAAFAVTDGGEICSWNASAEALFGFGRNEAAGKTCFELLQGAWRAGHARLHGKLSCARLRGASDGDP